MTDAIHNLELPEEYAELLRQGSRQMPPHKLAEAAMKRLENAGVRFAKDQSGSVHLLFSDKKITINPDFDNTDYAKLQEKLTGQTTADPKGRQICQRLLIAAKDRAAKLRFAQFSTLSEDSSKLFIPTVDNKLVEVSPAGIRLVPNAANDDAVYVEHPYGQPFRYIENADVAKGLNLFEELCVNTQATKVPQHKWLIGVRLGLFPYVRSKVTRRLISNPIGPTQSGKTSGANHFTFLHGLGEVKGNVSIAYIQREGDIGLLALDNREQTNLNEDWVFQLLTLATGAEAGRATQTGERIKWTDRPIVVITSIEGVHRAELAGRALEIEYHLPKDIKRLDEDDINQQVLRERDLILSALMHVLADFFRQDGSAWVAQFKPLNINFQEDFRVNAGLLLAYATVSGRDREWAESVIRAWHSAEQTADQETASELPPLLIHMIDNYEAASQSDSSGIQTTERLEVFLESKPYKWQGQHGKLYITETGKLLTPLREMARYAGQNSLPTTAQGLARRLRELRPEDGVVLLTGEDDPEILRRVSKSRRIGLFRSA